MSVQVDPTKHVHKHQDEKLGCFSEKLKVSRKRKVLRDFYNYFYS